jgi:hypothetical protein
LLFGLHIPANSSKKASDSVIIKKPQFINTFMSFYKDAMRKVHAIKKTGTWRVVHNNENH